MILNLHCPRIFERLLGDMHQSGKKGRLAAEQCEKILDAIRSGGLRSELALRKRTKNGECRLANCIKYDLGHGYRMVTVKEGNHLFVPFVGGHDKTDQWLEQHRLETFSANDPVFECEEISLVFIDRDGAEEYTSNSELFEEDEYEEYIKSQLDDSLLQAIFVGLVR